MTLNRRNAKMPSAANRRRRSFIKRLVAIAGAPGFSSRCATGANHAANDHSDPGRRSVGGAGYVPSPGYVVALSGPGTGAPNTMSDVMYLTSAGPGSGSGNNYFSNWCSGSYAAHDSAYGSMVFCNGGDADYWGNEVYKFSLDTRKWSRESERSSGLNGKIIKLDGDPNFDALKWGEHFSPGSKSLQPGVPHSYDQMEYLPPHLGGGSRGSFMFPTRTIVYGFRRFSHPHIFDLSARQWRRASLEPGIVGIGNVDSPSWCFDSFRSRFWGIAGGLSGQFITKIHYLLFDSNTGQSTAHHVVIPQFLTPRGHPVSRYWPTGDSMIVAGRSSDRATFGVWACPLGLANKIGFVAVPLSGDRTPPPGDGYGLAYCEDLDCFFVRTASGNRQQIWRINPPSSNYLAKPWIVEEIHMKGATVGPKGNGQGMWKRLMYAPPLKSVIWVDDIQGPVYAYRPTGI